MSRRKQSNPKPLKSDLAHENLPLEFPAENLDEKGETKTWSEISSSENSGSLISGTSKADGNMVTVLEATPKKSETPDDRPASTPTTEDDRKSPTNNNRKPDLNENKKQPKIRLKAGLATDPALNLLGNIKTEFDAVINQSTPEYLASLPPAIQSALASRNLLFPPGLNLNEAVAAMAAAQRVAAPADVVRAASVESTPSDSARSSVPIFQCVPCGIRFSSLSTLEAHQTYYCSHRPNKPSDDDANKNSSTGTEPGGTSQSSDAADGAENGNKSGIRTVKQYTCMHCSYSADKKVSLNRHMRMHTVSPGPVAATGTTVGTITAAASSVVNGESSLNVGSAEAQDRYCTECDIRFSSQKTFRAHKMHYCNSRHVVKPTAAPSSCTSSSSPTSPVDPTMVCRTPPSPNSSSIISSHHQISSAQQPFLALPTNPIIIVPYSLFRSASVLPTLTTAAGVPTPDTPCFLLPNGTLQPMTTALNLPPSHHAQLITGGQQVLKTTNKSNNNKEPPSSSSSSSASLINNNIREISSSVPLDLTTTRKSPQLLLVNCSNNNNNNNNKDHGVDHHHHHQDHHDEKENFKHHHQLGSPEKIECEPSIHGSPTTSSSSTYGVSPKRKLDDASRSNSPFRSSKTPKLSEKTSPDTVLSLNSGSQQFDLPPGMHPLLVRSGSSSISSLFSPEMRLSDLPPLPPVMPQVIVKQGVSKCKECNIVFCKHENYLVHKKHYCFARPTEDDASKTSSSPPVSPRSGGTASPATQYQQLICLACGIKFTSPDNLNAHQQYYCLKRNSNADTAESNTNNNKRCTKCRGILEAGQHHNHQCVSHSAVAGWKCPCCDVISATASSAQRHMETHTGVKAYRCTICKYKGNTLRGMKTHIRMHFDKRSPDLQEEKYISYILDDDSIGTSGMEVAIAPSLNNSEENSTTTTTTTATNSASLAINNDQQHTCSQCPYSSPYKANVVRHIKLVHETNNAEENTSSNGEERSSNNSIIKLHHSNMPALEEDGDDEIIVKKEAIEPEVIIADGTLPMIKEEPSDHLLPINSKHHHHVHSSKTLDDEIMQEVSKPGAHYCKSCDIYFNYPNSFIAHKKFYCSSHAGEISNANNNNNNNATAPAAPRVTETSVL